MVGIVGNTALGPRDTPAADQWYMPAEQPSILYGSAAPENLIQPAGGFIALRSSLDPEQMVRVLRSSVAEVDPLLALDQVARPCGSPWRMWRRRGDSTPI